VRNKLNGTDLTVLSMVEQSLLYRLVQESITNACKHAEASTVRTVVEMDGNHLVISVADDGKGIDKAKWRDDSRGVRYMRQRADLIGASIAWRPGEGDKGTVVEIRMNLDGRNHEQAAGS
jgi:signal transduction histidine kinase